MDSVESKFNEAQFQMIRGHEIQSNLNIFKLNFTGWNIEFNDYNYNVIFLLLNNLLAESSPKLTNKEKTKEEEKQGELQDCLQMRKKIGFAMKKYPIHKNRRKLEEKITYVDNVASELIKELLYEYELMIRKYRDKHGLSSPNKKQGLF